MTAKNPLEKLSDAQLADRWGAAKAELDESADEIKAFKTEFDRRKLKIAEGKKFVVLKDVKSGGRRLDSDAVKTEMGAAWWDERCKDSTRTEYIVSEKGAA